MRGPIYKHDCEVCAFYGTFRDANGQDVDIYVHTANSKQVYTIRRHGSNVTDYTSKIVWLR